MGYSGDFFADAPEVTWKEVGERAGMPPQEIENLLSRELTTVTKRLRRVFEHSNEGLRRAVEVSGANKISLNFVQYIDWRARGMSGGPEAFDNLPPKVREFIGVVEHVSGLPVVLIGTDADNNAVIDREK